MKAYDLAEEVAGFSDWFIEKPYLSGILRPQRRSLQRSVTLMDAHVALIRMLYEILPSQRAAQLISSEPITDTEAIAAQLRISSATARKHIQTILERLGVHTRLEAVAYATRHNLLPPAPAS